MQTVIIYHNPRCSKSRQALAILQNEGIEPVIIDYLKTPLDINELKRLRSYFDLEDFVRTAEPVFKEQGLSMDNEIQILQAMVKQPVLMQRPIVTFKNKAVIGRPPENVLQLFK
ncbi:arsenate reductase (glutaredoxin) [Legionella spiritensis]|uniref:Arsenate reductase n=1 Tax=Legionella spiritensis TaxID=452 RepID=A0A0W0Z4L5_LEGSP|nr:arsenate reductase (glutaredoxin) [Legionella spiritensis]KTD64090.1 arsenate reductase [Legionella spiritensis]SNV37724.1 arsenate reductase [Legionella spiritensis]